MKNILCLGDSLTWGFNPGSSSRYPLGQRWPGFLKQFIDLMAQLTVPVTYNLR